MSERWAAVLPKSSAAFLGPLRLAAGIEVCERADSVWLRGTDLESVDMRLCGLPDARRFRCLADGQLIAVDRRVPSSVLPTGDWTPLTQWLTCAMPAAVWPGAAPPSVRLRLVRASTPVEPSLLLLPLCDWQAYVTTAPQVRLDRLAFAIDSAGRVLVRGTPLPPLGGQRFVEFDGIAVPVGWHWQPAVDAATLRVLFGLDRAGEVPAGEADAGEDRRTRQGDLVLLTSEDCAWQQVPAEAFAQATRSAVRLSAEAANERS